MIQSPELMFRFIWNPHGFQVVDLMLKGEIFTAAYDSRNILTQIVSLLGVEREVKGGSS
jgi:hypothetical protein